jgi:hypothetical protein
MEMRHLLSGQKKPFEIAGEVLTLSKGGSFNFDSMV